MLKKETSTYLRVMFQDEARFGMITETRSCWCPFPVRPTCSTMMNREYVYAYSAVSIQDGQLDSLILPKVNMACMEIFLKEISKRYPEDMIVMVMDGASWHTSSNLKVPENIKLLFLPSHSPQLNPAENIWEDLREKYFHNRIFSDMEALEEQLVQGLRYLEENKNITQSIVSWDWIINAIPN